TMGGPINNLPIS
ncbi:hypothetical protein MIMGU_mgv1a0175702mg, partial [Erythranthe guttata]